MSVSAAMNDSGAAVPSPSLVEQASGSRRYALEDVCSIGRDPSCSIHVDDPLVSLRHAEIRRGDDGIWHLVDLGSRRGTFVGGRKVADTRLAHGDEILVGPMRLRFEHGAPDRAGSISGAHPALGNWTAVVRERLAAATQVSFPAVEQVSAPEDLRRDYEKLRAAFELTRVIGVQHDLSALIDAILGAALQLFSAERATVVLLDNAGQPTDRKARSRTTEHAEPHISTSLLSEVISTKTGVIVCDAGADQRFQRAESLAFRRVRSAMCVPMVHGGRVAAILHLESRTAADVFGHAELEICSALCNQAALAIENALLVRRIQTVLEEDRRRMERIVSALPAGVLLLDAERHVVTANERGRAMLPLLMPPAADQTIAAIGGHSIDDLAQHPEREVDVTVAGTRPRVFAVSASSSDGGGETVLVLRDVTAERAQEQRTAQQERLALIGQLAGGVAHDFNNLLAVILSYTDFVRGAVEAKDVREDVEEIHGAAVRASELTRQLLAFSRREMVTPRVFELDQLITDMAKLLRRTLGESVALSISLSPDLPRVKADASKIEQVLVNLAVNARDAMPSGGTLTVETRPLDVVDEGHPDGLAPGRYAVLTVRDSGVGMPPDVVTRVFEPFFTTKERGRGTGLGLAMVYGIVQQAGGTITVASQIGEGTTFRIALPATVEALPARPGREPTPRGGNETVLLAEDEHAVRAATRRILAQAGYQVLEAAGGAAALELLAQNPQVQLLLTDLVMPGMSGKELAERVGERRPDIRMVYMSGYIDGGIPEGSTPNVEFVAKPFTRAELLARIEAALAPSRERRDASKPA